MTQREFIHALGASCVVLIFCCMVVLGCERRPPGLDAVMKQLEESANSRVDLAKAVPGEWERVCFFGPYTLDESVDRVLGFDWNTYSNSTVTSNEGKTLLVFVQGQRVVEHFEVSRRKTEFDSLRSQCISRQHAVFVHMDHFDRPGLYPESFATPVNPEAVGAERPGV